jgi:hypothetical protein
MHPSYNHFDASPAKLGSDLICPRRLEGHGRKANQVHRDVKIDIFNLFVENLDIVVRGRNCRQGRKGARQPQGHPSERLDGEQRASDMPRVKVAAETMPTIKNAKYRKPR